MSRQAGIRGKVVIHVICWVVAGIAVGGFFGALLNHVSTVQAVIEAQQGSIDGNRGRVEPKPFYGFLGTPLGGGAAGLVLGLVVGVLTALPQFAKNRKEKPSGSRSAPNESFQ